ncbi:hypothetical protein [Mycolicibacterium sp.]|uniref:hypothetical protein n=1 Tax=Mycolicibacterium sp. TaxID=2320850 RepID=UPI0037C96B5F
MILPLASTPPTRRVLTKSISTSVRAAATFAAEATASSVLGSLDYAPVPLPNKVRPGDPNPDTGQVIGYAVFDESNPQELLDKILDGIGNAGPVGDLLKPLLPRVKTLVNRVLDNPDFKGLTVALNGRALKQDFNILLNPNATGRDIFHAEADLVSVTAPVIAVSAVIAAGFATGGELGAVIAAVALGPEALAIGGTISTVVWAVNQATDILFPDPTANNPAYTTLVYSANPKTDGGGTVSVDPATGLFTYQPSANQRAEATTATTDTFTVTATDPNNKSAPEVITVPVLPLMTYTLDDTTGSGPITGTASVPTSGATTLTYTLGNNPGGTTATTTKLGGTVTINTTGDFTYTPPTNLPSDAVSDTFNVNAALRGTGYSVNGTVTVPLTDPIVGTWNPVGSVNVQVLSGWSGVTPQVPPGGIPSGGFDFIITKTGAGYTLTASADGQIQVEGTLTKTEAGDYTGTFTAEITQAMQSFIASFEAQPYVSDVVFSVPWGLTLSNDGQTLTFTETPTWTWVYYYPGQPPNIPPVGPENLGGVIQESLNLERASNTPSAQ